MNLSDVLERRTFQCPLCSSKFSPEIVRKGQTVIMNIKCHGDSYAIMIGDLELSETSDIGRIEDWLDGIKFFSRTVAIPDLVLKRQGARPIVQWDITPLYAPTKLIADEIKELAKLWRPLVDPAFYPKTDRKDSPPTQTRKFAPIESAILKEMVAAQALNDPSPDDFFYAPVGRTSARARGGYTEKPNCALCGRAVDQVTMNEVSVDRRLTVIYKCHGRVERFSIDLNSLTFRNGDFVNVFPSVVFKRDAQILADADRAEAAAAAQKIVQVDPGSRVMEVREQ